MCKLFAGLLIASTALLAACGGVAEPGTAAGASPRSSRFATANKPAPPVAPLVQAPEPPAPVADKQEQQADPKPDLPARCDAAAARFAAEINLASATGCSTVRFKTTAGDPADYVVLSLPGKLQAGLVFAQSVVVLPAPYPDMETLRRAVKDSLKVPMPDDMRPYTQTQLSLEQGTWVMLVEFLENVTGTAIVRPAAGPEAISLFVKPLSKPAAPETAKPDQKQLVNKVWPVVQSQCQPKPGAKLMAYYPEVQADGSVAGIVVWGFDNDYVKTPFRVTSDGAVSLPEGCDPRGPSQVPTAQAAADRAWGQIQAMCKPAAGAAVIGYDLRLEANRAWYGTVGWGSPESYVKTPVAVGADGAVALPEGCDPRSAQEPVWAAIQAQCNPKPGSFVLNLYPHVNPDGSHGGTIVWGTHEEYVKTPFLKNKDGSITLTQGCDPRVQR